jgi:alpha-L-fucosidase
MVIDGNADTYWATDDTVTTASLTIEFKKPTLINRFLAQEYISLGQRVKAFTVEALVDGNWKEVAKGTTIGYKRIVRFPGVLATQVRFTILESKSPPVICTIGVFNAPVFLNAPTIIRNQAGEISIAADDIGPLLYYTLDGSEPTSKSNRYVGPVKTEGKVEVKAIVFDPATGKSSPVAIEKFDLPRTNWKILQVEDSRAYSILDGDIHTGWHQPKDKKMPIDLVIDLGSEQTLSGFRYFPDQNMWEPSYIARYEFYISTNNEDWKLVSQGEFPNIKNNPLWQVKNFAPAKARYIKFRALKNTEGNNETGYAEVEVITN